MSTASDPPKQSLSLPLSQFNQAISAKRKQKDIMKLLMSDYKVTPNPQNPNELTVVFKGPTESFYKTGVWDVLVLIPEQYPYKSPSIGFVNKIYHPNIDEMSGSVCLDVINQAWSPMYDLTNVFDIFLPQLLTYPNPKDPLNPDAAALLIVAPDIFRIKAKQYVIKFAQGDPNILKDEKFLKTKTKVGGLIENLAIKEPEILKKDVEEEKSDEIEDEKMSQISGVSDLSKTSNIELLEEGY